MEFKISLDYTIEDIAAYWRGFMQKRPGRRAVREASPRALRLGGWFFLVGGAVSLLAWPMFRDLGLPGLFGLMMRTPLAGLLEVGIGLSLLRQSRQSPGGPPYPRWVNRAWKKYRETGRPGWIFMRRSFWGGSWPKSSVWARCGWWARVPGRRSW